MDDDRETGTHRHRPVRTKAVSYARRGLRSSGRNHGRRNDLHAYRVRVDTFRSLRHRWRLAELEARPTHRPQGNPRRALCQGRDRWRVSMLNYGPLIGVEYPVPTEVSGRGPVTAVTCFQLPRPQLRRRPRPQPGPGQTEVRSGEFIQAACSASRPVAAHIADSNQAGGWS